MPLPFVPFAKQRLLGLTSLILRTWRPTRPSTAAAPVVRVLLRREAPEETSHRAPDLSLHQLTNDRDDALLSRHPPPPCYGNLPYPRRGLSANAPPGPSNGTEMVMPVQAMLIRYRAAPGSPLTRSGPTTTPDKRGCTYHQMAPPGA